MPSSALASSACRPTRAVALTQVLLQSVGFLDHSIVGADPQDGQEGSGYSRIKLIGGILNASCKKKPLGLRNAKAANGHASRGVRARRPTSPRAPARSPPLSRHVAAAASRSRRRTPSSPPWRIQGRGWAFMPAPQRRQSDGDLSPMTASSRPVSRAHRANTSTTTMNSPPPAPRMLDDHELPRPPIARNERGLGSTWSATLNMRDMTPLRDLRGWTCVNTCAWRTTTENQTTPSSWSSAAFESSSSENAPRARGAGSTSSGDTTNVRAASRDVRSATLAVADNGETSVPRSSRVSASHRFVSSFTMSDSSRSLIIRSRRSLSFLSRSAPSSRFIAAKACRCRCLASWASRRQALSRASSTRISADATVASRGVAWSASARALFCVARASNAARCLSVSAGTSGRASSSFDDTVSSSKAWPPAGLAGRGSSASAALRIISSDDDRSRDDAELAVAAARRPRDDAESAPGAAAASSTEDTEALRPRAGGAGAASSTEDTEGEALRPRAGAATAWASLTAGAALRPRRRWRGRVLVDGGLGRGFATARRWRGRAGFAATRRWRPPSSSTEDTEALRPRAGEAGAAATEGFATAYR